MTKHENFQENMYNKLNEELQKFIKGKSPVSDEVPPSHPKPSSEPSTDDLKSMLMARLLAEGDSGETDLVHAFQRNTNIQPTTLANQVTKSSNSDVTKFLGIQNGFNCQCHEDCFGEVICDNF